MADIDFGFGNYQRLLDRAVAKLEERAAGRSECSARLSLRPVEVQRLGGRKTLWINPQRICEQLQRSFEHVRAFVVLELGNVENSVDGHGRLILKGAFLQKTIESVLKRYVKQYVKCAICGSFGTKLVRDSDLRMTFLRCHSCGSSRPVESTVPVAAEAEEGDVLFAEGPDRDIKVSLGRQDIDSLNCAQLSVLSEDVIMRQATMNVGTIGHVAHGKSTLVKKISGKKTAKFKKEMVKDITIKLGYANSKLYRGTCSDMEGECFASSHSGGSLSYAEDGLSWQLDRHVSFVDCPGHEVYMATMVSGAAVMDAALLVIAADFPCPQPQTAEHLAAIEIMGLKHVIIVQTKIDLVSKTVALAHYDQIVRFVSGTVAEGAPIIPVAGNWNVNIDEVCRYISRHIPLPVRDFTASPTMSVIRSFDINRPGTELSSLRGGVIGGSIVKGVFRVGDEIELRPGIVNRDVSGNAVSCQPLYSRITSLRAEENDLTYAVCGGLIGMGTTLDPSLAIADGLVGQVVGLRGRLPKVFTEITVSYKLLRRVLGSRSDSRARKLHVNEVVLLNIGSSTSEGRVLKHADKSSELYVKVSLNNPVCCEENSSVAISRVVEEHWRLVGWGKVMKGAEVPLAISDPMTPFSVQKHP